MFPVAAKAQKRGDDHLRSAAFASALDSFADDAEAGTQVRPIDLRSFNTVSWSFVSESVTGELARGRGRIRVLVIGDNEDQGKLFDCGLIESFVKRAGGSCAIADASRAHETSEAFHSLREQCAVDDGDHRSQMADHGQVAFAGPATMDVTVAPAHRTLDGSKISARGIEDRFPESKPASLIANERGKDIAFAESDSYRDAEGLLAASDENPAVDFACAVKGGEFFVENTAKDHQAECLNVFLASCRKLNSGSATGCPLHHCGFK